MEKGLSQFCRDVDKLTQALGQADHFHVKVPREGDHLILVKKQQVVKVKVVDVVLSSMENTGAVTARIVASPPFTGVGSLVGQTLSGVYAEGESVWTDKQDEKYIDYRLFIKGVAKDKPFYRLSGRMRKVVKTNNSSINIALTSPLDPSLFKECSTLQDVLRWSTSKRHILSASTTVFNAGLSVTAILAHQSPAAILTAICACLCFICLQVELRRIKVVRDEFVARKEKLDKQYLTLKADILNTGIDMTQRGLLQKSLTGYHFLIMDYIHAHFSGLATSWAGQLHNAIDTLPEKDVFVLLDQYRDALALPD